MSSEGPCNAGLQIPRAWAGPLEEKEPSGGSGHPARDGVGLDPAVESGHREVGPLRGSEVYEEPHVVGGKGADGVCVRLAAFERPGKREHYLTR